MSAKKKESKDNLENEEILEIGGDDLLDEDFYLDNEDEDLYDIEDSPEEEEAILEDVVVEESESQPEPESESESESKTKSKEKSKEKSKPKTESKSESKAKSSDSQKPKKDVESKKKESSKPAQSQKTQQKEEEHKDSQVEVVEDVKSVHMEDDEITKIISKAKKAQSNKALVQKEEELKKDQEKIEQKIKNERKKKDTAVVKKRVSYVTSKKKLGSDNDYVMLLGQLDDLLSHLPQKKIEEFAQSKHFDLYATVIEKIQNSKN